MILLEYKKIAGFIGFEPVFYIKSVGRRLLLKILLIIEFTVDAVLKKIRHAVSRAKKLFQDFIFIPSETRHRVNNQSVS